MAVRRAKTKVVETLGNAKPAAKPARRGARRDLDPGEHRALCRVLATLPPDRTITSVADEWNLSNQSLTYFKRDNAREIAAIAEDLDNQFAGQWVADKQARIEAYMREYDILNKHKYHDHHEWSKARQAALRAIAEELGQIPGRGGVTINVAQHMVIGVEVEDLQ